MKKIFITCIFIFILSISGCGTNNKTSVSETNTTEEATTTEITTEEITTEKVLKNSSSISNVNDVAKALIEQNLLSGEPTEVYPEMINALDGIKYPEQGVEIYEYDTSSDTYKMLKDGSEIPIQGMDGYTIKADAINNKFVLIFSNEKNQTIIDAFNKLEVS